MYPPSSSPMPMDTATNFVPSADDATDCQYCIAPLLPVASAVPESPVAPSDVLVLPPVVVVVPPVPGAPLPPLLHPPATVTTNTHSTANFMKTEHSRFAMKSPVARETGIDDPALATRGSLPGNDHRETWLSARSG